MDTTEKAKRINHSLTKTYEERLLKKMASSLPQWINSDHMTTLGMIATVVIAVGYILTHYSIWWLMLCNAGLVLHWYGDSLDGTLARVRKQERERYGYFIDHICDVWTIFIISIAMGFSPLLSLEAALFTALAYCLMNVYVHIIAYTRQEFLLSHGKLGPTEFRIAFIIVNCIAIYWNPDIRIFETVILTGFDIFVISMGMALILLVFKNTVSSAKYLYKLDQK